MWSSLMYIIYPHICLSCTLGSQFFVLFSTALTTILEVVALAALRGTPHMSSWHYLDNCLAGGHVASPLLLREWICSVFRVCYIYIIFGLLHMLLWVLFFHVLLQDAFQKGSYQSSLFLSCKYHAAPMFAGSELFSNCRSNLADRDHLDPRALWHDFCIICTILLWHSCFYPVQSIWCPLFRQVLCLPRRPTGRILFYILADGSIVIRLR